MVEAESLDVFASLPSRARSETKWDGSRAIRLVHLAKAAVAHSRCPLEAPSDPDTVFARLDAADPEPEPQTETSEQPLWSDTAQAIIESAAETEAPWQALADALQSRFETAATSQSSAAVGRTDRLDPETLATHLKSQVAGQDAVISDVVDRLCLTKAGFDLRPDRPDGVFLFAGPTGVGKTALASALATGLGAELIRVDMSEFSNPGDISRLTGSSPGYVGHDNPQAWLTTRVTQHPSSVILFDEIEKAHPDVWNIFLQIFDAGRLTDGRGTSADFSQTVICMTTNIGASSFTHRSVGFESSGTGRGKAKQPTESVSRAIEDRLPPELRGRIDYLAVFNQLAPETILEIARLEIETLIDRMNNKGYILDVDETVIDYIARDNYDPSMGARHLHRSIESNLLIPLARTNPGTYRVKHDGDSIVLG